MRNKEKIAISIDSDLLKKIDEKVDKIKYKNRSHVIENLVRDGLNINDELGAIIVANESRWDDGDYPLDIPKAMIKVDSKTLIQKHIEGLKKANINKVVVAVGFMSDKIRTFLEGKNFGIEIIIKEFNTEDNNGKVISKCSKILGTSKTLVILADTYFHNLNLTDFILYHNSSGTDLSIVVKPMDDPEAYGNLKLEGNNIVKFVEKPKLKSELSFIINAGIYLMNSSIIPSDIGNKKIESDFFPYYVENNKAKAYFHNGKWFHLQSNKILNLFK